MENVKDKGDEVFYHKLDSTYPSDDENYELALSAIITPTPYKKILWNGFSFYTFVGVNTFIQVEDGEEGDELPLKGHESWSWSNLMGMAGGGPTMLVQLDSNYWKMGIVLIVVYFHGFTKDALIGHLIYMLNASLHF